MFRNSIVWTLVGGLTLALAANAKADRVGVAKKGSLLAFSKVEVKFNIDGDVVLQDTIVELTNDYPGWVDVQMIMLNGDRQLEEECSGSPCDIVREYEPGWNTSDCRFELTPNQPMYWSAAGDFCPFTALDMNGPGRPDAENGMNSRVLRGTVLFFAVGFDSVDNTWKEIRWNHLTGTANIINYADQTAWEYKPWAFQTDEVDHGQFLSNPGTLSLDGAKYDTVFDRLILDFFASGSDSALSNGSTIVSVDTDLTLVPMIIDLRQDHDGPTVTKALTEIWNEGEVKFSETRRCICCWDEVMLSDYARNDGVPNHFLRSKLGTDKGKARIDGVASDDCIGQDVCHPYEIVGSTGGSNAVAPVDAPLLGVAAKMLHFDGSINPTATSGSHLVGMGEEGGEILYDTMDGPGELRDNAARTSGAKGAAKGRTGSRGGSGR